MGPGQSCTLTRPLTRSRSGPRNEISVVRAWEKPAPPHRGVEHDGEGLDPARMLRAIDQRKARGGRIELENELGLHAAPDRDTDLGGRIDLAQPGKHPCYSLRLRDEIGFAHDNAIREYDLPKALRAPRDRALDGCRIDDSDHAAQVKLVA